MDSLDMVVEAQRQAAEAEGCPFWDMRAKMGGKGAMQQWVNAGMAQYDHVHFTSPGYRMLGDAVFRDLMSQYDVFLKARADVLAQGDGAAIRAVFLNSTRYVLWLILPVQLGLLFLGRSFLGLWLGPEYAVKSYPTLVILAVPLSLALSQSVPVRILYGTGRLRHYAYGTIAEAVANLLLSVLLVRQFGIEGVALGTAIPNVIFNVVVGVCVCRWLGVGLGEYLRRSFLAPGAAALVPAAVWLAAVRWAEPDTWLSFLATGAAGVAVYFVLAAHLEFGLRAVAQRLSAAVRPAMGHG